MQSCMWIWIFRQVYLQIHIGRQIPKQVLALIWTDEDLSENLLAKEYSCEHLFRDTLAGKYLFTGLSTNALAANSYVNTGATIPPCMPRQGNVCACTDEQGKQQANMNANMKWEEDVVWYSCKQSWAFMQWLCVWPGMLCAHTCKSIQTGLR